MNQQHDSRDPNGSLPSDHLDPVLREWHDRNAARARELRAEALERARRGSTDDGHGRLRFPAWIGRGLAAAAVLAIAVTAAFLLPIGDRTAFAAGGMAMLPDGGRLEAFDRAGSLIGPCALVHTDVRARIDGPFTRVTLTQRFRNPYQQPIEAVYTFPLSERGAVDSMRMTIRDASGERFVDGVVKERSVARQMYEAARAQGFVASLLEQERPNIFTQSVANIAPGAEIDVTISYVETLVARDGTYEFAFPMTVGPRYVPAAVTAPGRTDAADAPQCWKRAQRVVLLGPARVQVTLQDDPARAAALQAELANAYAIEAIPHCAPQPELTAAPETTFTVTYADGSQEPGELHACGIGRIGGRYFALPSGSNPAGAGFAPNTAAVPDASRITPMPVRPETRAGHDVSVTIELDTGGVPVREATSVLHGVDMTWDGTTRAAISLRGGSTIPNKDFVLRWNLKNDAILEGVFAAARAEGDGYLTLVVNPPARVAPKQAVPRELVFVVDTSGSMSGFPIEKSKEVMRKALAAMRADDTFNMVTFAGDTHVLWPTLRAATKENVEEAMKWLDVARSGGGTEMMKAVDAALVQMPRAAVEPSSDGAVSVPPNTPVRPGNGGEGSTDDLPGAAASTAPAPMRIAAFLTDAFVGNDQGIVAAIRANAGTTRVFSFGIGNSVNRWLIEQMAVAGRGASEIVLLADDADKAVARLSKRLETPVLADIRVATEGLELRDMVSGATDLAKGGLVPDVFDAQPLVIHARCTPGSSGAVVLRGRTGEGPWERRIAVRVPGAYAGPRGDGAAAPTSPLPQLWARARVDAILADHLQAVENETLPRDIRRQVVSLGESYSIMTPYTSFVAVERTKVVSNGRPMLVTVPIELPEGTRFDGFFGECWANEAVEAAVRRIGGESPFADAIVPAEAELAKAAEVAPSAPANGSEAEKSKAQRMASSAGSPAASMRLESRSAEARGRMDRLSQRPLAGGFGGGGGSGQGGLVGSGGAQYGGIPPVGAVTANVPDSRPGAPATRAEIVTESAVRLRDASGEIQTLNQEVAELDAAPAVSAPAEAAGGTEGGAPATGGVPGAAATGIAGRALPDGSVAYRVEKGDTLSTIAQRGYGRAADWKRILDANAATLKGNERALRPGAEIIVPGPVVRADAAKADAASLAPADLDRLARVLDRRLLAILLYDRLPADERAKLPALEAELSRLIVGGTVEVIVRATDAAALDALAASGLRVNRLESRDPTDALAIITIPVVRLQEVALMQGIRAIAPAGK